MMQLRGLLSRPDLNHVYVKVLARRGDGKCVVELPKGENIVVQDIRLSCPSDCTTVLVASHLASSQRVASLQKMLESASHQSLPANVHVSWSAEAGDTTFEAAAVFAKFPHIWNYHRSAHMSQFEHMQSIVNVAAKNTYILFSDDDDVWDEQRVAFYGHISKLVDTSRTSSILAVLEGEGDDAVGEYWQYAVKSDVLKEFFEGATRKLLKHPFCDIALRSFISSYRPGAMDTAKVYTAMPMYAYKPPLVDAARFSGGSYHMHDRVAGLITFLADNTTKLEKIGFPVPADRDWIEVRVLAFLNASSLYFLHFYPSPELTSGYELYERVVRENDRVNRQTRATARSLSVGARLGGEVHERVDAVEAVDDRHPHRRQHRVAVPRAE